MTKETLPMGDDIISPLTEDEIAEASDPRRWIGLVYRGSKSLEPILTGDFEPAEKLRAFSAVVRASQASTQLIKRLKDEEAEPVDDDELETEALFEWLAEAVNEESGGTRELVILDVASGDVVRRMETD